MCVLHSLNMSIVGSDTWAHKTLPSIYVKEYSTKPFRGLVHYELQNEKERNASKTSDEKRVGKTKLIPQSMPGLPGALSLEVLLASDGSWCESTHPAHARSPASGSAEVGTSEVLCVRLEICKSLPERVCIDSFCAAANHSTWQQQLKGRKMDQILSFSLSVVKTRPRSGHSSQGM